MINKEGEFSLSFTVSLVFTLIIIVFISIFIYKYINPNCDPASVDVFNNFSNFYEDCTKSGECGKFDFSNLDVQDSILIRPEGDKLENTLVVLECKRRESFIDKRSLENVKLCFTNDKTNALSANNDDFLRMSITHDTDSDKSIMYVGDADVELYRLKDLSCFLSRTFERARLLKEGANLLDNLYFEEGNDREFILDGKQYSIKLNAFGKLGDEFKKADIKIKYGSRVIDLPGLLSGTDNGIDLDEDGKKDVSLHLEVSEIAYRSYHKVSALIIISDLEEKNG